jgi:hypothetical protein
MATDTEIILLSLQKERDELHERILQVDRIIKRVKSIDYGGENLVPLYEEQPAATPAPAELPKPVAFPKTIDIKIQVLRVFDIVGCAASLSQLQEEFSTISGNAFKIRETVRSLYNVGLVKQIKYKYASRGFLWVKTEWLKDGVLQDKYKPVGFDLLHKPESLIIT